MATRQFIDNFKLVTEFYQITGQELEEAKTTARNDMKNAETCFTAIAEKIRAAIACYESGD